MNTRLFGACLCALSLVALAGCGGSKPVEVSGKLVLVPNTKLAETDSVNLIFSNTEPGGSGAQVSLNKDMSFTAKAQPGNYKIAVTISAYMGEKDSVARTSAFEKSYEAFSVKKTNITYEVTSEEKQNITIDLAKGRAAKN